MRHSCRGGFTLLELMIAVAIVAILASIAVPSYMWFVTQSRRTEAQTALVRLANLEESYYLDNSQYGSLMDLGLTATSAAVYSSENGYYSISVVLPSSSTFSITATAQGSQSSDSDCLTFSITQDGTKSSTSSSNCWN